MLNNSERSRQAKKVTVVGFLVNVLLTLGKLFSGFAGNSSAMIADGFHSLSDFLTDIIVYAFVGFSGKDRDSDHRYGHGKFETFATLLISFSLGAVGLGIFWAGARKIIQIAQGVIIEQPGIIALAAAIVSIVSKEGLFWYTYIIGKRINNQAVIANAWHHRSDAFSSIATAAGISGAIFLGEPWRILDPIAGVIISVFIMRLTWKLAYPSIQELLEHSLPVDTEKQIIEIIMAVKGVKAYHNLKTRRIGNTFAIEVHVKVDKDLSVEVSHSIATEIENLLRENFGSETHISIHIEPFYN